MSKSINLFGIHVANILLEKYPEAVLKIYIQNNWAASNNKRLADIVDAANGLGVHVNLVASQKLESLAMSSSHQGVVIECKSNLVFKLNADDELKQFYQEKLSQNADHKFFILILDEIQDPHNLGACVRSAEAMGVDCIIVPQRNSANLTSTVCKVSAGAALLLPVFQVTNLVRTMSWLKEQGIWVYGAAMGSDRNLFDIDFTSSIALVMGAEGSGLRDLTKKTCDEIFMIPMAGETESLNVSVATGVSLYEVTRQRN